MPLNEVVAVVFSLTTFKQKLHSSFKSCTRVRTPHTRKASKDIKAGSGRSASLVLARS